MYFLAYFDLIIFNRRRDDCHEYSEETNEDSDVPSDLF